MRSIILNTNLIFYFSLIEKLFITSHLFSTIYRKKMRHIMIWSRINNISYILTQQK